MTATTVTVIEQAKVDAINAEHRQVTAAAGEALVHARECGRMLAAVKAMLRHGEWLPWLERHFEDSERTAQLYMQLAAGPAQLEDPQRVAHLSIREAVKQLAKPKPAPRIARSDTISSLSAFDDDEDTEPRAAARADAELRAPAWSQSHSRRRTRILELLDDARARLEEASADGLAAHAIHELLGAGETKLRQAAGETSQLRFQFER